jgi:hypothetical protein
MQRDTNIPFHKIARRNSTKVFRRYLTERNRIQLTPANPFCFQQRATFIIQSIASASHNSTMFTRLAVSRVAPSTLGRRFQSSLATALKGMAGRHFISIDELR